MALILRKAVNHWYSNFPETHGENNNSSGYDSSLQKGWNDKIRISVQDELNLTGETF